jgi:hypothetical protein
VHVLRELLDQIFSLLGNLASFKELFLEISQLLLCWEITCHQQPQDGLWTGLSCTLHSWSLLDYFKEIMTHIVYAVLWVKLWGLIYHSKHTSHASQYLTYCDISNLLISMVLSNLSYELLLIIYFLLHNLFKLLWHTPFRIL